MAARTLAPARAARLRGTLAALAALALAVRCSDSTEGGSPGAPPDAGDLGTLDLGTVTDAELPSAMPDGGSDGTGEADAGADTGAPDEDGEPDGGPAPDGFVYPCEPLTTESCVTACGSAGQRRCLKAWGPCVPPDEFCGNCVDDDCDGLINEGCPPNPECEPPEPECPVAVIVIGEGAKAGTGDVLHLSAAQSSSTEGAITAWQWEVEAPPGASGAFSPSAGVESPTFSVDLAGQYLFTLTVWDDQGTESCEQAQAIVSVDPVPPLEPDVGCSDGEREGYLDEATYTHIAGCAGAWTLPGITPASVVPACGGSSGDDSANPDGDGCTSADLCADGWHLCDTWSEVAQKSPTGCAGSVPGDAKPKSIFFALRQPSVNGSVCSADGQGINDVFGCGNLGAGLGPDKSCGPLDRVLASTQPDSCGFNEAEPPLGPWECIGGPGSDLEEGGTVTKKGCPGGSCSYDGAPVDNADKGGVLCCRDS